MQRIRWLRCGGCSPRSPPSTPTWGFSPARLRSWLSHWFPKPLTYEEVAKAVKATAKMELVEWQGRLLLRYLQRADPPLLVRERKRYRALNSERFPAAAERYWRATSRR